MWELGGGRGVGVLWHGLVELLTVFVSVRVLCFSCFCWRGNEEVKWARPFNIFHSY